MNTVLDALLSNALSIFSSSAVEVRASILDLGLLYEVCFSQIIHGLNYSAGLWKKRFRIQSICW